MNEKNDKIARIFKSIIMVSIILIIGSIILSLLLTISKKVKLTMIGSYGLTTVKTGSMDPTITVSDLIVIKKTNDYKPNDIIVYHDNQSLVIHRLIRYEGSLVVTKGDYIYNTEEKIDSSLIEAEVIFVIPYIGALIKIIKSPYVITIIVGGAMILLSISFLKEKKPKEGGTNEEEKR